MASIYRRGTKLWIRFKGPDGKWTQAPTAFRVGQEKEARTAAHHVQAKIDAGLAVEPNGGRVTLGRFARKWIQDRRNAGVADWKNDEARLRVHVLPTLGGMEIALLRPRHVLDLIRALRQSGKVSPKTVYNVYSVLRALFRDAAIEEHVETSPCILTKHHLGANEDADPEWRATAIYSRGELEMLIGDPRIPQDRRVVYGLEGVGGLRHGEAAGLRWRHYDTRAQPLHGLLVAHSYDKGRAKRGPRHMPVHRVLAAILGEWYLAGWEQMMGRRPTPDDLIVPRPPEHGRRRRGDNKGAAMRDKNYSRKRLMEDLAVLGLRHRRGHDLRRTFISLARTDGARADLLERVTHNPAKKERSLDVYSSFEWEPLCCEVAKLNLSRPPGGGGAGLPKVVGDGDGD